MNTYRKQKLITLISILTFVTLACGLILYALKQNINLFYTPTELIQSHLNKNQIVRIGGYVKKKSVIYNTSGQEVTFIVTDRVNEIIVRYQGVLPNLFREGQGVVVTGKRLEDHLLIASEVLAKHDENYMPPAIAKKLKEKENHAA
jgi:cytochrome c-type biogenesis protein CcmE